MTAKLSVLLSMRLNNFGMKTYFSTYENETTQILLLLNITYSLSLSIPCGSRYKD